MIVIAPLVVIKTLKDKDKSFADVTESDYYLSDTIVKSFDRTKVGTIKSGKNIIISESKSYESKQRFSIFKIISLTSNKLVIQSRNMRKLAITFVADRERLAFALYRLLSQ